MAHISECQICEQPLVDASICPECQREIDTGTFTSLEALRVNRQIEIGAQNLERAVDDLRECLHADQNDRELDDLEISALA